MNTVKNKKGKIRVKDKKGERDSESVLLRREKERRGIALLKIAIGKVKNYTPEKENLIVPSQ